MKITETGTWSRSIFGTEMEWNINYSSILTKLIQDAGRYCEAWASDLFIIWKYDVDNRLQNRDTQSFTIKFGFRDTGVDHDDSLDTEREYKIVETHYKTNCYYYRKIDTLTVTVDGNKITMELEA